MTDTNNLPGMRAWNERMLACLSDGVENGDITETQAVFTYNRITRETARAETGIANIRHHIMKATP